jgi:calcium-dependent protein kinase
MFDMLSAIRVSHKMGRIHGGIKPENVLFINQKKDSLFKILDFTTSMWLKESKQSKGITVDPLYTAPESHTGNYSEKSDIWSCGIILHLLLVGYPPFFGVNPEDIREKV